MGHRSWRGAWVTGYRKTHGTMVPREENHAEQAVPLLLGSRYSRRKTITTGSAKPGCCWVSRNVCRSGESSNLSVLCTDSVRSTEYCSGQVSLSGAIGSSPHQLVT